jgi:branched-chain amino acid transport system ATP-binding protein
MASPPVVAGAAVACSIAGAQATSTILRVDDIEVVYGRSILAVRGLSLQVAVGTVVVLLGANGAGKSTTLKAISSLLRAESGDVTRGRIAYRERDITHADPADLVRNGLAQVLEGRRCFQHLSVEENLVMGDSATRRGRTELKAAIGRMYTLFPRLRDVRQRAAGYLSGGEQQMLAIARVLMTRPRLVLLDEPSMGLAPQIVEQLFEIVRDLNQREGVSFLVAEQNAAVALRYADRGYLVENGRVSSEGTAEDLLSRDDVNASYLGGNNAGRERAALARPRRPQFGIGSPGPPGPPQRVTPPAERP